MNEIGEDRAGETLGGAAGALDRLSLKMDELVRTFQSGFADQKAYTNYAVTFAVTEAKQELREKMKAGFSQIERRFDRLEERLFKDR